MNKKLIATVVIVSLSFSFSLQAQEAKVSSDKRQALGIRISSQQAVINNSISYKYFFNPTLAAEGLLSFSDPLAIGALLEKHKPFGLSGLSYFYGGGAYVGFGGGRNFGVQGIVGLDLLPPTLPINLSIDWKPELNFTKQFSFEPAAVALSARFAF